MTYTTYVSRTDPASSDGYTLATTLAAPEGAQLISAGAVVAYPSGSGNVPDSYSTTAQLVWVGPSDISSASSTIAGTNGRAVATNVSTGECLWITITVLT